MDSNPAGFQLITETSEQATLALTGDWAQGRAHRDFDILRDELPYIQAEELVVDGAGLGQWDSVLMAFLLQCYNQCCEAGLKFSTQNMPEGVERLLRVATTVPEHNPPPDAAPSLLDQLNPARLWRMAWARTHESLAFIGELSLALFNLVRGRANTRFVDFRQFCYQAGPDAFAIISLTSLLVGMILAYLGAVQLQQFGAEIYVADLVVIGMLREMGVLMTAIVMAGRTGAAYAAQLGTMQTNEEIDAITTMGISPMEFLIVPRMLALVVIMPLLTVYANLLGMIGGGIVAGGMGITPLMYIAEGETALGFDHMLVGIFKSLVFAVLIAVAGCRAGINSGRSSAAVGQAATEAVVTSIVYLIVADAAINIICQQVGI
ncbi:STAS domain-containing protein [Halioglobus maricola]|uniref:STAS domain-containing protein n=1 Tax=Halioglobus maricola TaxID=2601894 RepID=A0A5P9NGJ0_9GAMM|nr:ABC transporter permease [Halioglobus maricola]QFU74920.1 STAS domain-containing protein [Halioglobus maricola]